MTDLDLLAVQCHAAGAIDLRLVAAGDALTLADLEAELATIARRVAQPLGRDEAAALAGQTGAWVREIFRRRRGTSLREIAYPTRTTQAEGPRR